MKPRSLALVAALGLAAGALTPTSAYEDYALKEGLRCADCHEDTRTFLLTRKGRDYVRNGYSFEVKVATTQPKQPGGTTPPPKVPPVASPTVQLMRRAQQVLEQATRTVSLGYYQKAAEAAGELQSLAGKMEGELRAQRRLHADLARVTRDAAFRLERTLRTEADRRIRLAPLHLSQVVGACLRCHAAEGISQEDWSRDPLPKAHRPHSRDPRPEGALPSGRRSWEGVKR